MKISELIVKLSIFFLIAPLASCAIAHRYGEFNGKVVDIETKEPLEGAAVLAVYYTQQPGPGGDVTHYADAQETLTNKSGEFKIPSNIVTTFRPLQYFDQYIRVTIFKPGYGCYPEHKDSLSSHYNPSRMISESEVPKWSLPQGEYVTIQLPRLKTKDERVDMPSVNFDIPYEKQDKFIELINQEMEKLGATGKYSKESFGRR